MTARIRLPSIRNSKPLILRNGSWSLNQLFSDIAQTTSREVGRAWVFALAVATIVVWAVTGPLFHFSDTWQLVINTGTTIITFLMVFLIQNSQNRDAAATIVVWAVTGPLFHFSDTWQLVINTGTTIITFLMVFLIQNSQNRDAAALQLKLDELIRVSESARNKLLTL